MATCTFSSILSLLNVRALISLSVHVLALYQFPCIITGLFTLYYWMGSPRYTCWTVAPSSHFLSLGGSVLYDSNILHITRRLRPLFINIVPSAHEDSCYDMVELRVSTYYLIIELPTWHTQKWLEVEVARWSWGIRTFPQNHDEKRLSRSQFLLGTNNITTGQTWCLGLDLMSKSLDLMSKPRPKVFVP